ncbi:hypothetical protein KIPB_015281, partial [Kipferlia bialata]|eukprot:g15281.t1
MSSLSDNRLDLAPLFMMRSTPLSGRIVLPGNGETLLQFTTPG